jgi:hypothetical protein
VAGSNEKFAAPRPQIVDAQVDGANIRKLSRQRLFGFFGERRERNGEAADHVGVWP